MKLLTALALVFWVVACKSSSPSEGVTQNESQQGGVTNNLESVKVVPILENEASSDLTSEVSKTPSKASRVLASNKDKPFYSKLFGNKNKASTSSDENSEYYETEYPPSWDDLTRELHEVLNSVGPETVNKEFQLVRTFALNPKHSEKRIRESWSKLNEKSLEDNRGRAYLLHLGVSAGIGGLEDIYLDVLNDNQMLDPPDDPHNALAMENRVLGETLLGLSAQGISQGATFEEFREKTTPILSECNLSDACRHIVRTLLSEYKLPEEEVIKLLPQGYKSIWF